MKKQTYAQDLKSLTLAEGGKVQITSAQMAESYKLFCVRIVKDPLFLLRSLRRGITALAKAKAGGR